jgi:sulfotransferase
MNKTYFFLGGLSRSGGTLLSSILNQNPDIYVSEFSPVLDLTYKLNLLFDESVEYNASPDENKRINVLKSFIDNYYFNTNKKYIIDKHHSWGTEYNISMIKALYTENIKIVCPVRNVLEILASYVKIINERNDCTSFIDKQIKALGFDVSQFDNINDARCDWLMSKYGTVKSQLYSLEKCIDPSYKKYFHLVEYDDLVENPEQEVLKVYNFLEIPKYNHNYKRISYRTNSLDYEVYGIPDLHKVRPEIKKTSPKVEEVLSNEIIKKYKNLEFWRNV